MRNFNFFKAAALAAAVLSLAACGSKARISGVVDGASGSELVVSLLNVNSLETVDTVKVGADGKFSVSIDVAKNNPEFVYLYRKGVRIAPVLVQAGDRITVKADTLGNFSVSGSEEAELYAEVEKDYSAFLGTVDSLAVAGDERGIKLAYIDYYRGRLRFISMHPYSMTLVPVAYQTVGDAPVFGQMIDALHFNNICDSLETIYPESKYVKALRQTAKERTNALDLQVLIQNAEPIGYPDITLPDINAEQRKLSDIDAKVILVHFWALTAEQKMLNLDALLPLYKQFHPKGMEIYSVALEGDKTAWANTMKAQNLPWINVCDVAAGASKYITSYVLDGLPTTYIICDGSLVNENFSNESELRGVLSRLLD